MNEQQELDLEYAVYEHYVVELRQGSPPNQVTLHSTKAKTVDDAVDLIEGFRELGRDKHNVAWKDEEVDTYGDLYGLAPGNEGGEIWQIHVTPNLETELG